MTKPPLYVSVRQPKVLHTSQDCSHFTARQRTYGPNQSREATDPERRTLGRCNRCG